MDVRELWQKMLDELETMIPALGFDTLMETTAPVNVTENKLILCTNSEISKTLVQKRFLIHIREAMQMVSPMLDDVVVITEDQKEYYKTKEDQDIKPLGNVWEDANFIKKYTFDNFVVGSSNEFVAAASQAVSEAPGKKFNPLFIYGGVGLGKTHLLNAIGNKITSDQPQLKTLYVSCEKFTNELIEAIRDTKNPSDAKKTFRQKYRNCDVLMIDDIQFISKTDATQEELFHTFNDLYNAEKQIIISSDRPPREIQHLEDRLRTRFAWGLIADIKPPDLETRIAILQRKANEQGVAVQDSILKRIAESVQDNIRDMEGLLTRVISYASLTNQKEIDLNILNEALKDYTDDQKEMISAETIMDVVCEYFNVSKADLIGKKKNKEIVEPRQICMYLITEFLTTPLKEIGNIFGGRDHTTVIFARDKIAEQCNMETRIALYVKDLKALLLKK
ncbi:MAG: chromosomal replication initiator protein DnaA [Clostridia bacterium]|nr:chromosomal replication initiator protein DnaA [Clostridia bacterium]